MGTYEVCETSCLAASSSECVAYQYFDNKTCQFLTLCAGETVQVVRPKADQPDLIDDNTVQYI